MKSKYSEIVKHIPNLENHGHLYMYYGIPYSEECYAYGDDKEVNNNQISLEDKIIEALKNGYLIHLIKRLDQLDLT
ncbi:MAG: hypothetical protein KMY55_11810 [Dethiosulfatibacter sp.]|nr:hypothetical protein [Dethiosulfatibacter sp.]